MPSPTTSDTSAQTTDADRRRTAAADPAPRLQRTLKVAVAGLGPDGIERAMVLAHVPGCELVGLSDPRRSARAVAHGAGFAVPAWESAETMLKELLPDALFVCIPHDERASISRAALEAGVAVWVDPPMAMRGAEVEALEALAAERQVPLAAGFTLPYQPVFARARQAVAAGALGSVFEARATMHVARVFEPQAALGYERARVVGGALAHDGMPLLHALIWTLGRPRRVTAGARRVHGELEDELHGQLELPGGVKAILEVSWSAPGYPRPANVLEVFGANGTLLVSEDALELSLNETRLPFASGSTRLLDAELVTPARYDLGGDAPWLAVATFLEWVSGGPAPALAFRTALETQRVVDALYASVAGGGAPVEVAG